LKFFQFYSTFNWEVPLKIHDFGCKKSEKTQGIFITKHLNVIDPLRPNNNLGKSINLTNFLRIKRCFSKAHTELSLILENQSCTALLDEFFKNSWATSVDIWGNDLLSLTPRNDHN